MRVRPDSVFISSILHTIALLFFIHPALWYYGAPIDPAAVARFDAAVQRELYAVAALALYCWLGVGVLYEIPLAQMNVSLFQLPPPPPPPSAPCNRFCRPPLSRTDTRKPATACLQMKNRSVEGLFQHHVVRPGLVSLRSRDHFQ